MKKCIVVKIFSENDGIVYDRFTLQRNGLTRLNSTDVALPVIHSVSVSSNLFRLDMFVPADLLSCLVQEVTASCKYRTLFMRNLFKRVSAHQPEKIRHICVYVLLTEPVGKTPICLSWCYRLQTLIYERLELENLLAWLSTLGGAFSSLGDNFDNCAMIAGRISLNQMCLAVRLSDPGLVSRCYIYYSISLIQKGKLKHAASIIRAQYRLAITRHPLLIDTRLVKMCLGVWAKLQHSWKSRIIGRTQRKNSYLHRDQNWNKIQIDGLF